jgi:hypothetical protein
LVVDLMAAYGVALDDWQIDVLKAGCGVTRAGRWAAETVAVNVSRQNGKSMICVARALTGVLLFDEKTVVCSAHQQATSRQLFRALAGFFENFDDLRKRVKAITAALGREQIELRNGARVSFPARTRQTLRGWSVDAYLADEAQFITNEQWEAAKPALSARPNPAVWLFGTSPPSLADAEVFGRLRAAAHEGRGRRLAWIEYGAEPGCDLEDREQWLAANPGRVEISAMEAERRELSPGGFARERLNIWPTDRAEVVIAPEVWASLVGAGPSDGTPPSAIAVDANAAREMAVAAAWILDAGRVHVELVAADRCDPIDALAWVSERAGKRVAVVIDGASPAATLIPALAAAKVKTVLTTARDMGRACGGFIDDVTAGRLTHPGQAQLDAAVAGARRRPIGDAGLWAWDRRDGTVFVAPLVAATLARHGAVTAGRPRTNRAVFV